MCCQFQYQECVLDPSKARKIATVQVYTQLLNPCGSEGHKSLMYQSDVERNVHHTCLLQEERKVRITAMVVKKI